VESGGDSGSGGKDLHTQDSNKDTDEWKRKNRICGSGQPYESEISVFESGCAEEGTATEGGVEGVEDDDGEYCKAEKTSV